MTQGSTLVSSEKPVHRDPREDRRSLPQPARTTLQQLKAFEVGLGLKGERLWLRVHGARLRINDCLCVCVFFCIYGL